MGDFIEVIENGKTYYRKPNWQEIIAEDTEKQANREVVDFPVPSEEDDLSWLRSERNRRIAETDWTQLPDVPEETKLKWESYRQQLRDITNMYSNMAEVVWPDKPQS